MLSRCAAWIPAMKLHGEFTTIVRDSHSGRIVLAEIYDTIRERNHALLQTIGPQYKDKRHGDRYHIQVGRLSSLLPPLQGHPPENIARIAEQHSTPVELLMRAKEIEEERRRRGIGGFASRYRDLLIAIALAVVSSALLYEARQLHGFMDAMNYLGAASAAAFLAALWFLYRYCEDGSQFAVIGIALFLAAFMLDSFFGQAFEALAEIARIAGQPRDGPN